MHNTHNLSYCHHLPALSLKQAGLSLSKSFTAVILLPPVNITGILTIANPFFFFFFLYFFSWPSPFNTVTRNINHPILSEPNLPLAFPPISTNPPTLPFSETLSFQVIHKYRQALTLSPIDYRKKNKKPWVRISHLGLCLPLHQHSTQTPPSILGATRSYSCINFERGCILI